MNIYFLKPLIRGRDTNFCEFMSHDNYCVMSSIFLDSSLTLILVSNNQYFEVHASHLIYNHGTNIFKSLTQYKCSVTLRT